MVLIVIPTYKEAENLPTLLAAILAVAPDSHILVADDASPDGTADVADAIGTPEYIKVLRRSGPRGYGRACLDGFRYAIDHHYDTVLTMDADWSHDPTYIPAILRALSLGADMVTGSRYCNGVSVVNWPLRRVILSVFANSYVRAIRKAAYHRLHEWISRLHSSIASERRSAQLFFSDGYAFLKWRLQPAFTGRKLCVRGDTNHICGAASRAVQNVQESDV